MQKQPIKELKKKLLLVLGMDLSILKNQQKNFQNTQTKNRNWNTQKAENPNPNLNLWVLGAYVWMRLVCEFLLPLQADFSPQKKYMLNLGPKCGPKPKPKTKRIKFLTPKNVWV